MNLEIKQIPGNDVHLPIDWKLKQKTNNHYRLAIPHHGGPDANNLITEAINSVNSVINSPEYGPAIGSEGYVTDTHVEIKVSNHEQGDPRK